MAIKWFLAIAALGCLDRIITADEVGELDAGLEFFEYDLEDQCVASNNILWDFYQGSQPDLSKLITEELKRSELLKKEANSTGKFRNVAIADQKTRRKLELLFSSGAALLDKQIFEEFTAFAVNAQNAGVNPDSQLEYQKVQTILRLDPTSSVLAKTWSQWMQAVEKTTIRTEQRESQTVNKSDGRTGDLTQQLSLLDLEAEANGFDHVEKYWLSKSEISSNDYEGIAKLWETMAPFYQKLQQLLASNIAVKFGPEALHESKLLPVHLLGSLDSSDWTTAAERLGVLKQSETYSALKTVFNGKTIKDAYEAADEITAQLQLGYLAEDFFKNSKFDDGRENCVHFMDATCKSEVTPRVISCKHEPLSLNSFLRAHREVGHIKHHNVASQVDNGQGYLLREGPRDSVLYEAVSTATALMAVHPDNLLRRNLIKTLDKDANMTSLLIAALYIIPPLPLHLSYDLWRLQALQSINKEDEQVVMTTTLPPPDVSEAPKEEENENDEDGSQEVTSVSPVVVEESSEKTTNSSDKDVDIKSEYGQQNLTADWWKIRSKYQGVVAPDDQLYEDYLQDRLVLWNKPHISKFLGPILLFQILENFKTGNTTENRALLKLLLQKGKSEPWEVLVADLFNITKLDAQPMLNYFKPLESFLDAGAKFREDSTRSQFSNDDFKLFLHNTDLNQGDNANKPKEVKSASESSNALMIVLVGLAVVGSVAAIISVVRQRLRRRRQATDRKRYHEG